MSETIYIHYGSDHLDLSRMFEKHAFIGSKPNIGVWASREDAKFGWKD